MSTEPSIAAKSQEVQTESQGPKSQPKAVESIATKLELPKPEFETQEDKNAINQKERNLY